MPSATHHKISLLWKEMRTWQRGDWVAVAVDCSRTGATERALDGNAVLILRPAASLRPDARSCKPQRLNTQTAQRTNRQGKTSTESPCSPGNRCYLTETIARSPHTSPQTQHLPQRRSNLIVKSNLLRRKLHLWARVPRVVFVSLRRSFDFATRALQGWPLPQTESATT